MMYKTKGLEKNWGQWGKLNHGFPSRYLMPTMFPFGIAIHIDSVTCFARNKCWQEVENSKKRNKQEIISEHLPYPTFECYFVIEDRAQCSHVFLEPIWYLWTQATNPVSPATGVDVLWPAPPTPLQIHFCPFPSRSFESPNILSAF